MVFDEILQGVQNGSLSVEKAYGLLTTEGQNIDVSLRSLELVYLKERLNAIVLESECNINNVLLFDKEDVVEKELLKKNVNVTRVELGNAFNIIDERHYVCSKKAEDISKIVEVYSSLEGKKCVIFAQSHDGFGNLEKIQSQVEECVLPIFQFVKELKKQNALKDSHVFNFYCKEQVCPSPILDAMSAFIKTMNIEISQLDAKNICCEECSYERIASVLLDICDKKYKEYDSFVIREEESFVILPMAEPKEKSELADSVIKEQGVYLITGGMGGLGKVFASYISARANSAIIILVGRSSLDERKEEWIQQLKKNGTTISYKKADIAQKDEVEELLKGIYKEYGSIDGVIHAAGMIQDNYLCNKKWDEFEETLMPKVLGTVCLGEYLKDKQLDFFVTFSSISSIYGNAGQCDYSYGNRFMDEYMKYWNYKGFNGRGVSINWPFWKNGGMQLDKETIKLMENTHKIFALDNKDGYEAFEHAICNREYQQLLVVKGNREDVLSNLVKDIPHELVEHKDIMKMDGMQKNDINNITKKSQNVDKSVMQELIHGVAAVLQIDETEIYPDMDISEFGFDSITFTEFGNYLNRELGTKILPSVFYEYATLNEVCDYILEEYKDILEEKYEIRSIEEEAETEISEKMEEILVTKEVTQDDVKDVRLKHEMEPIAIIGISGVMPKSDNLEMFWENLINGEELITEIPKERWDWREIYADKTFDNKTNIKWGGFLNDIDKFDADFFGISPREAELMDPQHRLFLQTSWKTIEDAGYKPSSLAGTKTALFAGVTTLEYEDVLREAGISSQAQTSTGMAHSILVNRISYMFDFHGTSEAVDTACSSSLVAIHHAVEALRRGECEIAIAGGVNAILTPKLYISFGKAGMLANDGKCKTFDKKANGYVRGEGCGAVMLKTLSDAIKDNDHIYAVIKNSGTNHGGHVNSLTTPNPNAQADLIRETWAPTGISPSTITYMEAHGTGTSLGDPIEINGLKKAFSDLYLERNEKQEKSGYCGIGALKTNIGHLEGASGIAGMLKVILAMKHGVLPANINFSEQNPYIELEDSPFYLINESREWKRQISENGEVIPRRAGISSFGFGGVNAHIALEEYIEDNSTIHGANLEGKRYIVPLSAKTDNALIQQILQLIEYINNGDRDFRSLVYTLQLGREAMKFRKAFIVKDQKDLLQQLSSFVDLSLEEKGLYKVKPENRNGGVQEEELLKYIASEDLESICKLWTDGYNVNWSMLYEENTPKRISLPTYPFEKVRFWVENNKNGNQCKGILPFVDKNESNLQYVVYGKEINPNFPCIKEHVVLGKNILPGAAFLEMALEGIKLADNGRRDFKLQGVVFKSPFIVEDTPKYLKVYFMEKEQGVYFEIWNETDQKVCSMGNLRQLEKKEREKMDIDSIAFNMLEINDLVGFYNNLKEMGLVYGETYQRVKKLTVGNKEGLAFIQRDEKDSSYEQYELPYYMIDAAFQLVSAIVGGDCKGGETYIPFEIGTVEKYENLPEKCWVYTKLNTLRSGNMKADFLIMDEEGNVCAKIENFLARPYKKEGISYENVFIKESWKKKEIENINDIQSPILFYDHDSLKNQVAIDYPQAICVKLGEDKCVEDPNGYVVDCGSTQDFETLFSNLAQEGSNISNILYFLSNSKDLDGDKECETNLKKSIYAIKNLLQAYDKVSKKELHMAVCFCVEKALQNPIYAAIGAFAQSICKENAKLKIKVIEYVCPEFLAIDRKKVYQELFEEIYASEVRYLDRERYVKVLEQSDFTLTWNYASKIKTNGTYLITGGVGGVGQLVAQYLIKKYNCKVYLLGRGEYTEEKKSVIVKLGEKAVYIQGDVCDQEGLKKVIMRIKEEGNIVNGIFHCAGVMRDSYLINKKSKDIKEVVAPKIYGTNSLIKIAEDEKIDFIMLFSSTAGILGNEGQCDYSFANRYMQNMADCNVKGLTTLKCVDWPLWADGGMNVHENVKKMLESRYGMVPLHYENAMNILEHALICDNRLSFVYGEKKKVLKTLSINQASLESVKEDVSVAKRENAICGEKSMQNILLEMVSKILKIEKKNIDPDEMLKEFGFDSITFTELANTLNDKFDLELTPSIFYEYTTLNEFLDFLKSEVKEDEVEEKEMEIAKEEFVKNEVYESPILAEKNHLSRASISKNDNLFEGIMEEDPIAIVGMSCVMPQSDNADEFWKHLIKEDDLIEVIPKERWDWAKYYGDNTEKNKTNVKYGSFMKQIKAFDDKFFGIAPREAALMDPQQRIMMQQVWKTLEDAGITPDSLSDSRTGLFVGVSTGDYSELLTRNHVDIQPQTSTGTAHSILVNRISFLLNLHGPSEPVDTACSSALVAIHRAAQSIRNKECEMAIAGGVNIIVSPSTYVCFGKAGMISKDGHCKSFDKSADGYVRGEGCGVVLLMPLSKAKKMRCHIYGVIKGSAINHGGSANSLTAPNAKAQVDVIVRAWQNANLDPSTISYIEAHGTGTALGDPVEVGSIKRAFEQLRKEYVGEQKLDHINCAIGAVKTNIGHLEAASGIAGVIKILLAFKNKKIPANMNFKELNPAITLEGSGFYIPKECKQWNRRLDKDGIEIPLRTGISSFGFGGVNAHIVLEEYEEKERPIVANSNKKRVVPFSAKSDSALNGVLKDFETFCLSSDEEFNNIVYTLQRGRNQYSCRVAFFVNSKEELAAAIHQYLNGEETSDKVIRAENVDIGWIFKSTQGAEKEFFRLLIERNDYEQLARLWVNGVSIDWNELAQEEFGKFVSLPTYHFDEREHWFFSNKPENENDNVKENRNLFEDEEGESELEKAVASYTGQEVSMTVEQNGVALIRMHDKAGSNMLSENLVAGLIHYCRKAQENKDIRAIVITGSDKVFCMGGTKEQLLRINQKQLKCIEIPFLYRGLLDLDIPIISAIQGHAAGAGLALGLYADIVVMALEGVYQASFMKYGFTPGMGSTYILERKLGYNVAMEMMYTARGFSGSELKEKGASVIYCNSSDVVAEAVRIASSIGEKPRYSLSVLKNELASREIKKLVPILDKEVWMHDETFSNPFVRSKIEEQFRKVSIEPTNKIALKRNTDVASSTQEEVLPQETVVTKGDVQDVLPELERIINRLIQPDRNDLYSGKSFSELGMDSVIGVELTREINSFFGLNIETIEIYNYPNIKALAEYIQQLKPECKKVNLSEKEEHSMGNGGMKIRLKKQLDEQQDKQFSQQPRTKEAKQAIVPKKQLVDLSDSKKLQSGVKDQLKKIVAKGIGIDSKNIKDDAVFKDLGVDSIIGVEMIRDINKEWKINFETTDLYDNPTVSLMAKSIENKLGQAIISRDNSTSEECSLEERVLKNPIAEKIAKMLSGILYVPLNDIDFNEAFSEMGLDQIGQMKLSEEIRSGFKSNISQIDLFEYDTIYKLSEWIANNVNINETETMHETKIMNDTATNSGDEKMEQLIAQFTAGSMPMDEVKRYLEDLL